MSATTSSMIGKTIGPYKITSQLGQGGFGAVYLAEHQVIGRKAAVKLLRPELSVDGDTVRRFFNEARASTLVQHPGIVDVIDFGRHDSGSAYIVMEYLDGQSVATLLKRDGPMPAEKAMTITQQIASALAAAHTKGIVHRDLKPDNIFVVRDGAATHGLRVKVLDFGIAKLAGHLSGSLKTLSGTVFGTPAYMSPEQLKSAARVDHRADIYSLGCIMFEMVCGRPPFVAEGVGPIVAMHMIEKPPAPRSIVPSVPLELEALILKALSKNPDERPQTMQEIAAAVGRPMTRAPASAPHDDVRSGGGAPTTLSAAAGEKVIPAAPAPVKREARADGPRLRGIFIPAMLVLIVGAGVLAYRVLLSSGGEGAREGLAAPSPPEAPAPPPTPLPVELPSVAPDAAPKAPEKAVEVTHTIHSTPEGADVYRYSDGVLLGTTPFVQKVARGAGTAVFLLKLTGFADQRVELAVERDEQKTIQLRAITQPRTKGSRARPARRERVGDGVVNPYGP